MYSIADFGRMIANRERMEPYVQALRAAVRPGMVVADIGAGTGIFSFIACQLGARRVYAIEPNGAIAAARSAAAALGHAGRIEFIERMSTAVALPEKADLIVSDIRGALPFFQRSIPSLIDARRRLLAPGGAMIPLRDTVWAALAHAPAIHRKHIGVWTDNVAGVPMPGIARMAANAWHRARFETRDLRSAAVRCAEIEYMREERSRFEWEIELTCAEEGEVHGLALWFDAEAAPGILYSNGPGEPELVYGQGYFPWLEPVRLRVGDRVFARMAAWSGDEDFDWLWSTRIASSDGREIAKFQQGTWLANLPLGKALVRRDAAFVPCPNEAAALDRYVLSAIDGSSSLRDIADRVRQDFPGRFGSWEDALSHVGAISSVYSA